MRLRIWPELCLCMAWKMLLQPEMLGTSTRYCPVVVFDLLLLYHVAGCSAIVMMLVMRMCAWHLNKVACIVLPCQCCLPTFAVYGS